MMNLLSELSVRDLGPDTWSDFERFFSRYNGVQAGCWCMYYHRTGATPGKTPEERTERNRSDRKSLVMENRSRAVLVYHDGSVVASCQYGSWNELPRTGNGRIYRSLELPTVEGKSWRITCFFVDREYRRRGVAQYALSAVIRKIADSGGGVVEVTPVVNFKALSTWFGTVAMYEKEGFSTVSKLGRSTVVMRKMI